MPVIDPSPVQTLYGIDSLVSQVVNSEEGSDPAEHRIPIEVGSQ